MYNNLNSTIAATYGERCFARAQLSDDNSVDTIRHFSIEEIFVIVDIVRQHMRCGTDDEYIFVGLIEEHFAGGDL